MTITRRKILKSSLLAGVRRHTAVDTRMSQVTDRVTFDSFAM